MALSFNTYNMQNKKSPLKVILTIVALVGLSGTSYLAGVYTKPALANQADKKVSQPCAMFTKQIFAGKLDDAYNSASTDLKSNQSLDEFKAALDTLKQDGATISRVLPEVSRLNPSLSECDVLVGNLPQDEDGSTEALVNLTLAQENGTWKTVSVTVN